MATITTSTSESKNMTETVYADGTACARLSASLNGNQAGGCNITVMPTNEELYQANKTEIRPVIDDFMTTVLDQAQAQEYVDTTVTSETAPAEAETATTTKSKKSSK